MNWVCANTECAQPLRRTGVRAVDAPGTLQVTADGLCKKCYNKRRSGAEVLTPQQLQAARNALDGWLQGRRNRINKGPQRCVKQTKHSTVPATNSRS